MTNEPNDPKVLDLVNLPDVARFAQGTQPGEVRLWPLVSTGRTMAGWVILLICGILVLVSLYGWFTYPHLRDMVGMTEPGTEVQSYREYQSAWFGQIKDLLQLLVVSLLVPLFSTIVGYVFGRQMEANSQQMEAKSQE
jgi:hypothetical protein